MADCLPISRSWEESSTLEYSERAFKGKIYMDPAKKNIAVVGCGVSGLISIKCCLDEGLNPVCFEQHGQIGSSFFYTHCIKDVLHR